MAINLLDLRQCLLDNKPCDGANLLIQGRGVPPIKEKKESLATISHFIRGLLDSGAYAKVAQILWGPNLFTPEPQSVRTIWEIIPKSSQIIVIGAASLGKSFNLAVWSLLDWVRDPNYTCIKVLSMTRDHASTNVFAHIQNLFRESAMALPGYINTKGIFSNNDRKQGIHLVAIPKGDDSKARLRGYHPVGRPTPHPIFGSLTRIRVILDEAEEIPPGVWVGADNILSTKDEGVEHVKILAATNPSDKNSQLGLRTMPVGGWEVLDIEEDYAWKSAMGWDVIRLDAARCENIIQRKIVYKGLQTWEGYKRYLDGGTETDTYYTMGRGWFPEQGLVTTIIPNHFIERQRGSYIFRDVPKYCGGVDLAFQGKDLAIMTIGKYGVVSGYKHQGKEVMFEKPRFGIEVESQFELKKLDSLEQAEQIINICKEMGIAPELLAVDMAGNGKGVYDLLRKLFGNVLGINYGMKATETKIMEDDSDTCKDQYHLLVTECWHGVRRFLEFNYLRFALSVDFGNGLLGELTDRRYRKQNKKVKVEGKDEYKARGKESPDRADSLVMMVHVVRMNGEGLQFKMLDNSENEVSEAITEDRSNEFDNFAHIDFS